MRQMDFLGGFIMGALFISGVMSYYYSYEAIDEPSEYDWISKTSCDSDSMGLTLSCHDIVKMNRVRVNETLELGKIYVYRKINKTVIHRLVGCIDNGCNIAIFKGDNNPTAEFVERKDVIYKVVRVDYE